MVSEVNLIIGGEAGQGVQSAGYLMARALARDGYHLFADQDYESRVRGGHNFFRIRIAGAEVGAVSEGVDLLLAFNRESIDLHRGEMAAGGVIVFDHRRINDAGVGEGLFGMPLEGLAQESAGNKLAANTVALGAMMRLLGCPPGSWRGLLLEHFGSGEPGRSNAAAADAGYEYAAANFKGVFPQLVRPSGSSRRMLLNGNEAIALGAMAAGCKFVAAYPMTPSTSIMEYMAGKADELGLVVVQPEDEIAAINMIIGAAFAGVRTMTATSGGGFCLMVEGLGLAGMTETPIVVVDGQRSGPAIGLPTRTEQGDLEFVLHAAHGEFPRAVLAPGTVPDAFWLTVKAFNLAEEYQVPVVILHDQHLASSYATVEPFDLSRVEVRRGRLLSAEELAALGERGYRRHEITPSGVSPRALPLQKGALVVTDSDEHDQEGHMIEDAATRTAMMLKRLRKLDGLRQEIAAPATYGPEGADITLIGWGSTRGAIREAVDLANRQGLRARMIHLAEIWPFPAAAVTRALEGAGTTFAVENNATAQLAHLLRAETGHQVKGRILKFDGRPFSPGYIISKLKQEVDRSW
ncbi:MAG: 2-oxoacid:acceptor oxidoreductase subunit alpha [Chloroflexi bacterium]|nr:2-oxoacid:acceptor oxidoreductase subunit alpha [Chloroflexota bacterium]